VSNIRYTAAAEKSASPISKYGRHVEFEGFDLPDSKAGIAELLVQSVPPEFRPQERRAVEMWSHETWGLKRDHRMAWNRSGPLRSKGTEWYVAEAFLSNSVGHYAAYEQTLLLEQFPRCHPRSGSTIEIPGFYEPLEYDLAKNDALVEDRNADHCILLSDTGAPREVRAASAFDLKSIAESRVSHGHDREVRLKMEIEGDGSIVPTCSDPANRGCTTTVRFVRLEESTDLDGEIKPVYRRGVVDVLRTLHRASDHAVVRLTRCTFLTGPNPDWPAGEDVEARVCARRLGGVAHMILEFREGLGIVCKLHIRQNQDDRFVTRTWRVGSADASCLLNYEGAELVPPS
jgi:hypothetical protein